MIPNLAASVHNLKLVPNVYAIITLTKKLLCSQPLNFILKAYEELATKEERRVTSTFQATVLDFNAGQVCEIV